MSNFATIVDEKGWIAKYALVRLPRRFKRMIYMSSLFGLMYENQPTDTEIVRKLNELIDLARDSKTCDFPIHIRKAIWKKLDVTHLSIGNNELISLDEVIRKSLSTENCLAIGEQIAKHVPAWLRYGSIAVMANDVIILIKHLRNLHNSMRLNPA